MDDASFNHYNSRGDIVAKTDDAGDLIYQTAYEAFGRHGDTESSQEWGTSDDRQRANTKDEDPTGLLNEGFRYRDLVTGTFLTRDPLGFVDGPNVYTYVAQNPWTKFDPHGLQVAETILLSPTPLDDAIVFGGGSLAGVAMSGFVVGAGLHALNEYVMGGSPGKTLPNNPMGHTGTGDASAQQSGKKSSDVLEQNERRAVNTGNMNQINNGSAAEGVPSEPASDLNGLTPSDVGFPEGIKPGVDVPEGWQPVEGRGGKIVYEDPETGARMYPDGSHEGEEPHTDFWPGDGTGWRVHPDGRVDPKNNAARSKEQKIKDTKAQAQAEASPSAEGESDSSSQAELED